MTRQKLLQATLLGGLTSAVTFSFLITGKYELLNADYKNLKTSFEAYKTASGYTIKDLRGLVSNLKPLIVSKNKTLEQFIAELANAKTIISTLEKDIAIEKQISDVLSTVLEQERDKIKSLEQQINALDETVEEFTEEITTIYQNQTSLQQQYNVALAAVFEIDKINRELTNIIRQSTKSIEALSSYLSFYEKNSVVMKQGTCIHQLVKDTENDTEAYPYRECDGEMLVDGQKIDNFTVTIRPKDTEDKNSAVYKWLKKLYEDSLPQQ